MPEEPGRERMLAPVYLDCNATTPLDPRVHEAVSRYLLDEYGNEGSRTHSFGVRARQAVQAARDQVAAVVGAKRDEVVFTSGATEANNLALLGMSAHGLENGRTHIVATAIEHAAVLEPLEELSRRGFDVELIAPEASGAVEPGAILERLRPETLVVSVMQANNETGVKQPIEEIAAGMEGHEAYFHVDAAQGFGKWLEPLRHPRVDMLCLSGHKLFAPKGVGALVARRRGFSRPPLGPLMFGGGQERGLRPGTLPVALIVGLGVAAERSLVEMDSRRSRCEAIREEALKALGALDPAFNGDQDLSLPHVLNLSFSGVDAEALMVALKDLVAVSNGSACTSHSYQLSHVLTAMRLEPARVEGAVRLSWCHLTPDVPWGAVADRIRQLR